MMQLIHIFIVMISGLLFLFYPLATIEYEKHAFRNTIIIFAVFVVSGVFYLYGINKLDNIPWKSELTATEKVIALNDGHNVNGRYMRRSYISEELWYHYYVDIGDGFVANKVKSDSSTLYYTENNYRVEWYKSYRNWLWFSEQKTIHKIYIPEGSIIDDFTLDLQ